jgi:hypothetical protein
MGFKGKGGICYSLYNAVVLTLGDFPLTKAVPQRGSPAIPGVAPDSLFKNQQVG